MQNTDFPGLYQSADTLSGNAQKFFIGALFSNLLLLVLAALVSVINYPHWVAALIQFMLLLLALASSVFLAWKRPEKSWYSGRAVAESIKTMTWRYVSRAEPFDKSDEESRSLLISRLRDVVQQNPGVSNQLISHASAPQVTDTMTQLRAQAFPQRRDTYIEHRINDQLEWYKRKAKFNSTAANWFFTGLIVANLSALACAGSKIANPAFQYFPTDVFITVAAGILTWMQAKRFTELSTSYALTANEIALIREDAYGLAEDVELSKFVGDAENAFSREHTQWEARKDN
ncbi:DUF4231 domain-containing protein [Pseudomonas aeruginosa]|uniref:DUF4231 domain-containing protein n=1 Tax=Pseudomonas aeruginosa TaxID=287 RepID=UPI001A340F92|nr:DUF4231 domain-containing protein [Pseudomonas aeruginosa]MBG6703954.1 DUF4231 domain-containing protein [Pseudomonas aeruginosa]MBG7218870.1 DUF4231 domain-containing protein [Pseudomonas aeruginosa]MBG7455892.1 DUF4231 domain-containing protein [Pseudomonas aeruginosa]MCO2274172.1 DUF4231 domain-containing protein [Pseudomonas aeruginosa]MCO2758005.1 DUF4231 domain-containing protein [Pseudomonas aeruginosa]